MTGPRYTPLAASLPATVPFVGPEAQERDTGRPFVARLGANESIFGPSAKAIAAMRDAAPDIWKYGDSKSHDLREALAAFHRVTRDNILVGEGIDGLLGYLVRLTVGAGDTVLTSDGAYPTFNYHVAGFGGVLHKLPYRDDAEDLDGLMEEAARLRPKLVYLSNPDNPMGSWHSGDRIAAALDRLPDGTLLVLDEAYVEFAPEGTEARYDVDDPRVIRMRTFSKAYGMAGARVGYAMGAKELISNFDKIRNHFGMNRMAQAGALAALADQDWLDEVRGKVAASREAITRIAADNGLTALPSAANFVAVDCGRDGRHARAVLGGLAARGIFVRMPFVPPQDRCIRISCGPEREMELLSRALPEVLSDLR
ncbi:histidinol-phosphate aminotransferase [Salinihabitans flavidus]|uniref:histidinol-phosphate transaminase n=1 Tax=Salinihabitans flavidus TaxID=569882 RepID=A0A1H8TNE4_9RHOB|nr:pyridoxal phosphate-dependent aminotransferase [Salinihabitans flavidus]SEO92559.1 histidinol-phosphate aminotransferase [Salinihabitans flavidus]